MASQPRARLCQLSTLNSVQQTRILRLRLFNCVASVLLAIFNAAIAVWSMVSLNIPLTAINGFHIVQLLRGRHDSTWSRTSDQRKICRTS
jgi:hypothetical protein